MHTYMHIHIHISYAHISLSLYIHIYSLVLLYTCAYMCPFVHRVRGSLFDRSAAGYQTMS